MNKSHGAATGVWRSKKVNREFEFASEPRSRLGMSVGAAKVVETIAVLSKIDNRAITRLNERAEINLVNYNCNE